RFLVSARMLLSLARIGPHLASLKSRRNPTEPWKRRTLPEPWPRRCIDSQTGHHYVKRLEQALKMHSVDGKGVEWLAIDGNIEEGDEIIGEVDDKKVLDAALIAAAQAVGQIRCLLALEYAINAPWISASLPQGAKQVSAKGRLL